MATNMDADFWLQRWRDGRIGFHRPEVHPWLVAYLPHLGLAAGARVLVPLCGKSVDLGWLADRGLRPVGVEISPEAVGALFAERGVEAPRRRRAGALEHWSGGGMEAFCGDFFALDADTLGPVDAFWDRAALIAVPRPGRPAYAGRCAALAAPGTAGLLATMTYDPASMAGPPYPVPAAEVEALFRPRFRVEALVPERPAEPSVHLRERGIAGMHEALWLLTRTTDAETA